MASRCHCCRAHKEEMLTHLFLNSEVATVVWTCFGNILKLQYRFGSILQAIRAWMTCKGHASQFSLCKLSAASHILREIWVSWCRACFDGKEMKARQICLTIIDKVQLHLFVVIPLSKSTFAQHIALEILGIATHE